MMMKNFENETVKGNYEELNRYVMENIDAYLPEEYRGKARFKIVTKVNGVKFHGVYLEHSAEITAIIHLEDLNPCASYPDACKELAEVLVRHEQEMKPEKPPITREFILETARLYAVSKEKNQLGLAHSFEDLWIGVRCVFQMNERNASFIVTNKLIEIYKITEDEIFQAAKANTLSAATIKDMSSAIFCKTLGITAANLMDSSSDELEQLKGNAPKPLMLVVSNAEMCYGFATVLCDGVLEKLSEVFGGDFYILPSSVHESIVIGVVPEQDNGNSWMREMVSSINNEVVEDQEILSNSVYRYTEGKGLYLA